ncbi:nucleoporin protein Ndc1-Nup [Exophiala viscosa]|uniref:Nucleoporin protein Ndc1-Nup n=1 Tax=Exophiala viscosa TaxID=2486360 RepID=A0AAN6IGG3_9EURO|nr:nucleoporin protein Ndc1-Nup [Exophiala viscosa]KAI1629832.1 nucleoporin protein Ndc1-Nup [Exophiala viscosa]
MATSAATPTLSPPRPYRRFLNSAFHTRFVHAALLCLLIALNNAFWLASKRDLFWSWFPFGPAGLKALLFFMSSLFVFMLQVATLKVGRQTTTSSFAALRTNALSGTTFQTVFWYVASAWWFTEAYIWSSPDLGWITRGSHNTPDMLNEKPIFFRLYALTLAFAYAGSHLYRGNSSLIIPVSKRPAKQNQEGTASTPHMFAPIQTQLQQRAVSATVRSATIAGSCIVVAPFLNGILLRNTFWQLHLVLAKPFFNLSRANAHPIGHPYLGPPYLAKCMIAGFLLILTWEFTSSLFLVFFNQEPTKKGFPLSAKSKDPNGTLLNGLRAKRDVVRTFAFWELAIIAQKDKERRKTIFEDIERPTGPLWSQMSDAGLAVLRDIDARILGPPPKAQQPTTNATVKDLPRIVPELQTQSILQAQSKPKMSESLVSSPLRQIGSSQQPWRPPIDKTTKAMENKLLEYARPPGAEQAQSQSLVEQWMAALRKSPVGWFFLSTNAARINAAVLGSPNGNAALIVDAIDSITQMLVASLSEDTYGKATPTVPETVRTLTRTLTIVEGYVARNKPDNNASIEEVEIIIERLRSGLRELLAAFQLYLLDVGLGIADLNQAKKAVEPPKSEEQQPKPAEKAARRQLFAKESREEDSSNQQRRDGRKENRRLEPSQRSSENLWRQPSRGANGAQERRREMEQVIS